MKTYYQMITSSRMSIDKLSTPTLPSLVGFRKRRVGPATHNRRDANPNSRDHSQILMTSRPEHVFF